MTNVLLSGLLRCRQKGTPQMRPCKRHTGTLIASSVGRHRFLGIIPWRPLRELRTPTPGPMTFPYCLSPNQARERSLLLTLLNPERFHSDLGGGRRAQPAGTRAQEFFLGKGWVTMSCREDNYSPQHSWIWKRAPVHSLGDT